MMNVNRDVHYFCWEVIILPLLYKKLCYFEVGMSVDDINGEIPALGFDYSLKGYINLL